MKQFWNKKTEKTQDDEKRPLQGIMMDLHDLIYLLAIVLIIYLLMFRVVVVVGESMYDTLVDGDRVLIMTNMLYRHPKRGDVVVASKDSFRGGECIVKRIIATEGQTVDIDFETGTVYVDGIALEEDYIYSPTLSGGGVSFPLEVEKGCVFVMGDNRGVSLDSRFTELGQIDCREIMGKAIFLLFPGSDEQSGMDLDRIGVIS